jgi:hypothetical protein
MFNENQTVILSENIFQDSTNPEDTKMRGREGVVGLRMWEHMKSEDWIGCYEINFPDGYYCYVTEDEIRLPIPRAVDPPSSLPDAYESIKSAGN